MPLIGFSSLKVLPVTGVTKLNLTTGNVLALSDIPTPDSGINFNANLGTISNLTNIEGNDGLNSILTITGDLVVTGSITATTPGATIVGDTEDTNPDDIDGGTY